MLNYDLPTWSSLRALFESSLLSLSIWLPILGGLLVMALSAGARLRLTRGFALLVALLGFLVTLPLYAGFDAGSSEMQFIEHYEWIDYFSVHYLLGVDGISLLFVLLNSFVTLIVVIAAGPAIKEKPAQYLAAFLVMSGLLNGAFVALDGVLFYVFFEASLIPLYLVIGIWGGPKRVYAAIKFFLFTLLGSLLMLLAFIYLFIGTGSFDLAEWRDLALDMKTQTWIFWAFFASFAVKLPMWPVHTWLPDAHVEAPTGGSVVLAAIALKLGAYGLLRFSLPIVPDACLAMAPYMIALSLVAVIYIGLVALVQTDMKKLVAYSSISHMGLVTLGIFLFNSLGMEGAIVQMVSHGFVSAAMFLCIGVLYDRLHSRQIVDYGGVAKAMPRFAAFFMLFSMANAGLPATSGFVGEFLVILGAIATHFWIGFAAATTLVLGAAYTLWMYKRVIFGPVVHERVADLKDIGTRETLFLVMLALCVLALGLYPFPLTELMQASVSDLLDTVASGKL